MHEINIPLSDARLILRVVCVAQKRVKWTENQGFLTILPLFST